MNTFQLQAKAPIRTVSLALAVALFAFAVLAIHSPLKAHAAYSASWLLIGCEYKSPPAHADYGISVSGYNQYGNWVNQSFAAYWTGINGTYWWWEQGTTVYYLAHYTTYDPYGNPIHTNTYYGPYYVYYTYHSEQIVLSPVC